MSEMACSPVMCGRFLILLQVVSREACNFSKLQIEMFRELPTRLVAILGALQRMTSWPSPSCNGWRVCVCVCVCVRARVRCVCMCRHAGAKACICAHAEGPYVA